MSEKIQSIEISWKDDKAEVPPEIIPQERLILLYGNILEENSSFLGKVAKVYLLPDRIRVFDAPDNDFDTKFTDYFPGQTIEITIVENGLSTTYKYKIS